MYVSSYFTMVPPCLVSCTSIFSLVGPAWAYCPARPFSPPSLRSLHLSFPLLLPLIWFLTVTSCLARLFRWLLSMFCLNLLPSEASVGILSGSSLLSPLFLLSFPFPPLLLSPLCPPSSFPLYRCLPKAASPNVATPYDPKWSLAAMSCAYLRWCAHVLPPLSHTPPMLMVPPTLLAACGYLTLWWSIVAMPGASRVGAAYDHQLLLAPILCAAYGPGSNYDAGCCEPPATLLSLGTLPTNSIRVCPTDAIILHSPPLLFLNYLPEPS